MRRDRMFNVLVLGGAALVGGGACGASRDRSTFTAADAADDYEIDTGFLSECCAVVDGFPNEGVINDNPRAFIDAWTTRDGSDDARDTPGDDAGTDATMLADASTSSEAATGAASAEDAQVRADAQFPSEGPQ
jgi:hypothetical protein